MMKKAILAILLLLSLTLFACGKDEEENKVPEEKEYTITFVMYTERKTQTYKEGETIVPPALETFETSEFFVVFDGWEKEFLPVTAAKAMFFSASFSST